MKMKVMAILLFVFALNMLEVQCQDAMMNYLLMSRLMGGNSGSGGGRSSTAGQTQAASSNPLMGLMSTSGAGGMSGMPMMAAMGGGMMGDSFMQMMMCRSLPPQLSNFCMMEAMA
ncbi:uncharacterized protein LOC127882199 [Dreissena polymorpha]|uniref:Uncharacterized protein n=1 Tax=Dreissena polymorpha TaxID=45954 RepID=A0A9D4H8K4_DREPO|nr:uncharacterized protein LOC127882199 [Dreissena polymorpha]KAH3828899.1 hypothetical protein DPMN_130884 [Dreissena polymorpha]